MCAGWSEGSCIRASTTSRLQNTPPGSVAQRFRRIAFSCARPGGDESPGGDHHIKLTKCTRKGLHEVVELQSIDRPGLWLRIHSFPFIVRREPRHRVMLAVFERIDASILERLWLRARNRPRAGASVSSMRRALGTTCSSQVDVAKLRSLSREAAVCRRWFSGNQRLSTHRERSSASSPAGSYAVPTIVTVPAPSQRARTRSESATCSSLEGLSK
jgi:hypothetical protein